MSLGAAPGLARSVSTTRLPVSHSKDDVAVSKGEEVVKVLGALAVGLYCMLSCRHTLTC